MDKCREEFKETFKKLNKISLSDHAVIFGYPKREEAFFNAAWQEQQKRVDELQAKYDELNNRATQIALDQMSTAQLNYELQARVDALEKAEFKLAKVKSIIQHKPVLLESILIEEIKQALKGGEV